MTELLYKADKTKSDIELLLQQHKNLVYFMLAKLGQLQNQDCESAAWEALWDAICTFDVFSKAKFSTYACTVIRNAINNVLRRQLVKQKYECLLLDDTEEHMADIQSDIANIFAPNYVEALFAEYIAKMSGKPRNILLVWNASGYEATGKEIAATCNVSASYVSRVQRDFRAFIQSRLKRR